MADTLEQRIDSAFRSGAPIDAALKQAAREVLVLHKKLEHPIVEWRDGRAVWTPPEQIEIPPTEDPVTAPARREPNAA
jgi:hypothetical protein